MQWVCYIDVQGLYAAVARQAGLAPADRPVVVLKEGRVFDGSREAFAGGLVLGAPARQALRDVPQAVQVDFALLDAGAAARSLWDRCLAHTPYIEPVEAARLFLALPTPGKTLTPATRAEVDRLAAGATAHGFVAFVGVGTSKLAARAAALACKEGWLLWRPGKSIRATPETVKYVQPGEEERFLAPLPIGYLPAPPDVARRLARLGLRTIGEAARIPESEWLRQLGPAGRQVALWSRGGDNDPVKPCYPPRTLEQRVSFAPEVADRDVLESSLNRAVTALAKRLEASGEGCQQVELTIERGSGPPISARRTLAKLQQSAWPIRQALQILLSDVLAQAAGPPVTAPGEPPPDSSGPGGSVSEDGFGQPAGPAPGLDGFAAPAVSVSAMTAVLGLIGPMPWQQMELWDDGGRSEREERLERALTLLHERFPSRMVGLGPRSDLSFREQMLTFCDPFRTGVFAGVTPGAHAGVVAT